MFKIFLIHLGDEGGKEKTDLIYECCSHVWRTFCLGYYFNNNKVTCIPIGYKSGLTANKKKILEKNIYGLLLAPLMHQVVMI